MKVTCFIVMDLQRGEGGGGGGERVKRAGVSELSGTGERPIMLRIYLFASGSITSCLFVAGGGPPGAQRGAELLQLAKPVQRRTNQTELSEEMLGCLDFIIFFGGSDNNNKS